MRVRVKSLSEITEFINTLERPNDINHPINVITNLFSQIKNLAGLNSSACNTLNNEEKEKLELYHKEILYNKKRHLHIPIYSYTRLIVPTPFILYLLLALGRFVTEVGLLLHATIRDSSR